MGRSNCVHTFLISDGARLRTIFFVGRTILRLRNVARIRSFDSLIAASGNQIISMVGIALFASASIVISCHERPKVASVFTSACVIENMHK